MLLNITFLNPTLSIKKILNLFDLINVLLKKKVLRYYKFDLPLKEKKLTFFKNYLNIFNYFLHINDNDKSEGKIIRR